MNLIKPRKHFLGMAIALCFAGNVMAENEAIILQSSAVGSAEGNTAEVT